MMGLLLPCGMNFTDSDIDRFLAGLSTDGDCIRWTGEHHNGYGRLRVSGKNIRAHRMAYVLANGEVPEGLFVCHVCDIRDCTRLSHLFLGTHQDNMLDAISKGRIKIGKTPRPIRGTRNDRKLTEENVLEIRKLNQSGIGYKKLAKRYGVVPTTIRMAIIGRTWKALSPPVTS